MPIPSYLVDANVIVRFLTADHATQSPTARKIFTQASQGKMSLLLSDVCLAEVAWLLKSFYKIDRSQIAQWLTLIVDSPGLKVTHKAISLDALQRYRDHNIDYIDAYHAALAHAKGIPVVSFDRDFDRFTDIKRVESA